MRTVYFDKDFKCHIHCMDGCDSFETDFFDGKCNAFVEGYRYVPEGKVWTREDGTVFSGGMLAPWRDTQLLQEFQAQYEAILAQLQGGG